MAQDVAILDFGSGKISVLVGSRGVNNSICISGIGECDYAGFSDGAFLEPDQLSYVIGRALTSAETNSRSEIKHLYVGVPGEFTTCVCQDVNMSLGRKKVILDGDVDALHSHGNIYEDNEDYELINIQPIYYTLDDERRIVAPVGLKSGKIGGQISYILAEKTFINHVSKIMSDLNIEFYDYVSSLLAETLFLFDEKKRDQSVVLIDVGYITTNVVVAKGDGILQQFNFSLGGGHITGDLANHLNITFSQGEALKRKVVLSLDVTENDVYEISTGRDEVKSFPADIVNEIVMLKLTAIAKTVAKCLNTCEHDFPNYIPYHLTGGGIAYIKGARDFFSKVLDKPVEIIAPSLPQFNRPHLSSSLGLLDMVLNSVPQTKKQGIFSKWFKK